MHWLVIYSPKGNKKPDNPYARFSGIFQKEKYKGRDDPPTKVKCYSIKKKR
jgi:hypothetical protein